MLPCLRLLTPPCVWIQARGKMLEKRDAKRLPASGRFQAILPIFQAVKGAFARMLRRRQPLRGEAASFPLSDLFLLKKAGMRLRLHRMFIHRKSEQKSTQGERKRQTSVFNAGAATPCSAGARDRRAAQRPSGPAAQRPSVPTSPPSPQHRHPAWPGTALSWHAGLFSGTRAMQGARHEAAGNDPAAVPVSGVFGFAETRARPMSRGRARCGALWSEWGKGRL